MEHVYRSGPTGKAWAFGALPVLLGVLLIQTGLTELPRYGPGDLMWIPLAGGPAVLGCLLLIVTGLTFWRNLRCEVRLTGGGVHCRHGERETLEVGWDDLITQVRPGVYRVLTMSDGRRFVRLVDLFVPGYDRLVAELERHRHGVRTRTRHKIG